MTQLTLFDEYNIESSGLLSAKNLLNPALLNNLPFDEIYEVSRKEASRKKPVFFLHKYFARRTTCNFRLMLLSLLMPHNKNVWDNFYSSMKLTPDNTVTILDPFMGGGTTIFESVRIGAKVIGNDLQPLSKFVTSAEIMPIPAEKVKQAMKKLEKNIGNKIKEYFTTDCPDCGKSADVMYNFHVNQARSKITNEIIDLFSSFVLAEKKGTITLLCPECLNVFKSDSNSQSHTCSRCNHLIENPRDGYVTRGKLTHPKTGESDYIRNYTDGEVYPYKTRIVAQEYYCPHCKGHDYKEVSSKDIELSNKATKDFELLQQDLPIPFQKIPTGYNTQQMLNHGYVAFKDMFTQTQLLCLGLLLKEIESLKEEDVKYWLLLAFSASLEMNNKFCRYQYNAWKICNIFFNHAYVPLTMPVENNVWGTKLGTGTFIKSVNKMLKGKEFNNDIYDIFVDSKGNSVKKQSSDKVNAELAGSFSELDDQHSLLLTQDSRKLDCIPNDSVDVVLTDPPYGSNVMYSELIDFFHVWLHQSSLGRKFGFTDALSPKTEEIIVNPARSQTYSDYSAGLTDVFKESYRVTKNKGYLVFTFHDSQIDGWFSVIKAIYQSGFKLIAAYPIHSESRTGAHTSSKESIAFDIFLVCVKDDNKKIEPFNLEELKSKALSATDEIVRRLEKVNAEITIPDIENFFIAQYFVNAFECGLLEDSSNLREHLIKIIKDLENLVQAEKVVSKRTGWWSEIYNKKLKA